MVCFSLQPLGEAPEAVSEEMNDKVDMSDTKSGEPQKESVKKPYRKPTFRFQPAFEVSALQCGKVSATQDLCSLVRKAS